MSASARCGPPAGTAGSCAPTSSAVGATGQPRSNAESSSAFAWSSVIRRTATATLGATAGVVLYRRGDQLELMGEQGLHEAGMLAPAVSSMSASVDTTSSVP